VVVSELCPSMEVVETPVGGLEVDGEGWGVVLGRGQEVVNVAREVVVGHRRRRWRGGGNGPTPSGTHGSSCRRKTKKRWLGKHSSPNLDIQDHLENGTAAIRGRPLSLIQQRLEYGGLKLRGKSYWGFCMTATHRPGRSRCRTCSVTHRKKLLCDPSFSKDCNPVGLESSQNQRS